jgi:diaminohydroxyphosphoribosylaminopyrimidine deaminase/5-amino-6-(5-phosphoribosylamino)uracil reductase
MQDPNPKVNGRGFAKLKRHGIKINVGLLEEEAKKLNEVFIKYITTRRPFVCLKTAMTIDGKIATRTGASRWVAGPESLRFAHHLRNIYDAILVGVNNVLVDNPRLDVRRVKKVKNPIRIVLDTFARTPLKAKVLDTSIAKTIMVVGRDAPVKKIEAFMRKGAQVLTVKDRDGRIDIKELLKKLGEMKITSLLVEGGGEVNASFIAARAVDKAHFIIVPKIFGGRDAKTPVEGMGVAFPVQAKWLKNIQVEKLGKDFLFSGSF